MAIFVWAGIMPAQAAGLEMVKDTKQPEPKYVGSFFDTKVPEENYFFIKGVIAVFGNKFGKQPTNPQEIEDAVWDQLLLSFEAFRESINVDKEEVDVEVSKILQAEHVEFDWMKDKAAYEKWLKGKANEPPSLFESQIHHLIQLKKLREKIMAGIEPTVTDDEALDGFINENSSLDLELVQFDKESDARDFYNKVRANSSEWDKEKAKRPKDFRRPGGVTAQFLIDFWSIPAKALHEMSNMKPGEFYGPKPIYKGWGLFKVLGATAADESKFNEVKERYREKVKAGKRYEGFNDWFKKLKEDAKINVYPVGTENKDKK